MCKAPFSIRYALIEFLTGCLFLAVFCRYQISWAMLTYLVFTGFLVISTFTDVDYWIIPDRITKGGAATGIILALILAFIPPVDLEHKTPQRPATRYEGARFGALAAHDSVGMRPAKFATGRWIVAYSGPARGNHWWVPVTNSIVGAAVGSGILWAIAIAGSFVFRQPAMGLGDVKLLVLIGAFTGWLVPTLSIFLASLTGAAYGMSRILFERIRAGATKTDAAPESAVRTLEEIEAVLDDNSESARKRGWSFSPEEKAVLTRLLSAPAEGPRRHHIIFGPHLAMAAWVLMLFEKPVANWLAGYFGLY